MQQQQQQKWNLLLPIFFSVSKPECSKSNIIETAHAQRIGLWTIPSAEGHLSLQAKWRLKISEIVLWLQPAGWADSNIFLTEAYHWSELVQERSSPRIVVGCVLKTCYIKMQSSEAVKVQRLRMCLFLHPSY